MKSCRRCSCTQMKRNERQLFGNLAWPQISFFGMMPLSPSAADCQTCPTVAVTRKSVLQTMPWSQSNPTH